MGSQLDTTERLSKAIKNIFIHYRKYRKHGNTERRRKKVLSATLKQPLFKVVENSLPACLPSAQFVCYLTWLWSLGYIIKNILCTVLYPALSPKGLLTWNSENQPHVWEPGLAGLWLQLLPSCVPGPGRLSTQGQCWASGAWCPLQFHIQQASPWSPGAGLLAFYPPLSCTATHSSILAWRIPWTEEPGRLQSIRSQKVRHNWSNLARAHTSLSWMTCALILINENTQPSILPLNHPPSVPTVMSFCHQSWPFPVAQRPVWVRHLIGKGKAVYGIGNRSGKTTRS